VAGSSPDSELRPAERQPVIWLAGVFGLKAALDAKNPKRPWILALGVYVGVLIVYAAVAGGRLLAHTPYNHFAHLADAWLHGRQSIISGGPAYAQGNDFAVYGGKTYISFPPFPAVLMLPMVAMAGSPEEFRDGQFIVWLAGVGPAFLFLALEKLRARGYAQRSERDNLWLAFLFAFGTVYFFTAVQGTVWCAGHVVCVGLLCAYLWASIDAARPWLAGGLLGAAFLTRPTMSLSAVFFALEALRVSGAVWPAEGKRRLQRALEHVDTKALLRRTVPFALPIALALALASWMNYTRFHNASPTAFGHEHLTVQWHARIEKWGLFGLHYLGKNLGCMLTSLPWPRLFKVNEHGLALWFTTPMYLWLLWPKQRSWMHWALALAAVLPMLQNLLYQNSGWQQFGYRFSNDYAPTLFLLFAVGGRSCGNAWKTAAGWAIAWNTFGAVSFGRAEFERYYFREGSQTVVYQPD
jgi:hypothetical protein